MKESYIFEKPFWTTLVCTNQESDEVVLKCVEIDHNDLELLEGYNTAEVDVWCCIWLMIDITLW